MDDPLQRDRPDGSDHQPVKPLWPKPIPIIGGTGEYESGKTLFGLTICPGPQTRYYDFEQSGASYNELGHERINVMLTERHNAKLDAAKRTDSLVALLLGKVQPTLDNPPMVANDLNEARRLICDAILDATMAERLRVLRSAMASISKGN